MFAEALMNEKTPLASVYGAIAGLGEMGNDVIKTFLIPKAKTIGTRVELCQEGVGHTSADKIAAQKIKVLYDVRFGFIFIFSAENILVCDLSEHIGFLQKLVCVVIKTLRPGPDHVDEYKTEFGYLGPNIYSSVVNLRAQEMKAGVGVPVASKTMPPKTASSLLSSIGGSSAMK